MEEKEKLIEDQLCNIKDQKRKAVEDKEKMDPVAKKQKQDNICQLINKEKPSKYIKSFNCRSMDRQTFLPTVAIRIQSNGEWTAPVKALIDTGAQPNLVSYSLFRNLGLDKKPVSHKLIGVNGTPFHIRHKTVLRIRPWYEDNTYIEEQFWILPKESEWQPVLPADKIKFSDQIGNLDLPLADPNFWKPDTVQMLLGVGFLAKIINSVIQRNRDGIALMKTSLGVIVFGSLSDGIDEQSGYSLSAIEYEEGDQLNKLLERLWIQEQIGDRPELTEEEKVVEQHFLDTHKRDETGRFIVKLPLKDNEKDLGSSRDIALKRFMYLERKFAKNPEMKSVYVEKIRKSMKNGHILLATAKPKMGEPVYYIPHHCIEKDNRIVYDASCKTDTGISFNDIQMLGPKLQADLFKTIMRFRRHKYAIYADIKGMFNQVKLESDQWDFQRMFWRENANEPLKEYWLTVLIF